MSELVAEESGPYRELQSTRTPKPGCKPLERFLQATRESFAVHLVEQVENFVVEARSD